MFTLSLAQVLGRMLALALLYATNQLWLLGYLCGDMLLFFLYKIVNGDFLYWFNLNEPWRFIGSFVLRSAGKTLTDACLPMQLRHPQELGGRMFSTSMVLSQVSLLVSAKLYLDYYHPRYDDGDGDGDGEVESTDKLEEATLWITVVFLGVIWLSSAATLLLTINRNYIHTFIGGDTASMFRKQVFLALKDDQEKEKSEFVNSHPDIYTSFRANLKCWTMSNWKRFEDEKPEWFTDAWISKVPNDFIPFEYRVRHNKTTVDSKNAKRKGTMTVQALLSAAPT